MVSNNGSKSCVKCQNAVTSTEEVLVCGLWCRKYFHNDCVGLSNSETRVVRCSKERIKFHCETCENRLGLELSGEKEIHETNKLKDCVKHSLLELLQKILKLTNELSNDNRVINAKLDTVLSSNERLEEYILQPPKCTETRSEEITDNGLECVQRMNKISEENNDTNCDNAIVNSRLMGCAPKPHQANDNSSSLLVASDFPTQLSNSQQPNGAEEISSNCLQEWEVPGHQANMKDPLTTDKEEWEMRDDHSGTQVVQSTNTEECSPSEGFLDNRIFNIGKTEHEEGEGMADSEIVKEEYSSSEDFHGYSTFSIEKCEDDEDGEAVGEDGLEEDILVELVPRIEKTEYEDGEEMADSETVREELKHEVESTSSGNEPESTIIVDTEDNRNNSLATNISQITGEGQRIRCLTGSCGTKSGSNCVIHKCDICKQSFTNLQQLKEHTKSSKCRLRYSCKMCHKKFSCKSSLEKHLQIHTREYQKVCDICNMTFTHETLKQHMQLHSGKRAYTCSICNKTFTKKFPLQQHLRLHSGERPYSCSVCSKTFIHQSNLRTHFRSHSGEAAYTCSVCKKTFTKKFTLQQHFRLHSGERPYSCSVCSKTFTQQSALITHFRLHSGERPFSCSVCSKTFTQQSILVTHFRLHSGERPYSCSVCNKTFTQQGNLIKHFRLHSGERPYSCTVCSKTFTVKSSLQVHFRLHSGERPYSCSVCKKKFADQCNMKRHFRLHKI